MPHVHFLKFIKPKNVKIKICLTLYFSNINQSRAIKLMPKTHA